MSRAAFHGAYFADSLLRRIVTYALVVFGAEVLGGGRWSGLLYLALVLPYLLSLYAGGVIDRAGRRAVLQATCGGTLLLMLLLLPVAGLRPAPGALVLLLTLAYGTVSAFAYPGFIAAVPDVAAREEVGRVTVTLNVLSMLAHVAGPLAVGALRATLSWGSFFAAPALLAGGGWLGLQAAGLPRRENAAVATHSSAGIQELVALCRERPALAGVLLSMAIFSALVIGPLEVLTPLFADVSLRLPPLLAGIFLAVGGSGMVFGATGALALVGRRRLGWWLCGSVVGGALLVLAMTVVPASVAFPLFFLGGTLAGVFTSLSIAGCQAFAPDRLRGRVMGLYALALGAPPALGGAAAGFLSDALGVAATLRLVFALVAVAFVALFLLLPSLRDGEPALEAAEDLGGGDLRAGELVGRARPDAEVNEGGTVGA